MSLWSERASPWLLPRMERRGEDAHRCRRSFALTRHWLSLPQLWAACLEVGCLLNPSWAVKSVSIKDQCSANEGHGAPYYPLLKIQKERKGRQKDCWPHLRGRHCWEAGCAQFGWKARGGTGSPSAPPHPGLFFSLLACWRYGLCRSTGLALG